MEKAIIRKEWIKTWRIFTLCLVVSLAMALYAVLRVNRLIELKGAEHLWLIMLLKDQSFADPVKWTSLASGIAIALAQMLPEMSQKRLKLTLHLPCPQRKVILLMLVCGIAQLVIICLAQMAIIGIYDANHLPWKLVSRVLLTVAPWELAGFVAYLFTTAICMEGKRARRLLLGILVVLSVWVFFAQTSMEAYNVMIIITLIMIPVLLLLPLGSVIRFKEGLQD